MDLKIDIKNDCAFKNIFLRNCGKKYICGIISELLCIDYNDLLENINIYNTEHPRKNISTKSSYSDVIYEYKNKLFIIEKNCLIFVETNKKILRDNIKNKY